MNRGFTLMEVLLASVLAAMLAIGSMVFLNSAENLGAAVIARGEMLQIGRAAMAVMERDLQAAFASGQGFDMGLRGTRSLLDDGGADTLTLMTTSNNPQSETVKEEDLTQTTYSIDSTLGLIRQRLKLLSSSSPMPPDPESISKQVVGLTFRYHDGQSWNDSWDSIAMGKLPKAIEITLSIRRRDQDETQMLTSAIWLPVGHTYEAPPQ